MSFSIRGIVVRLNLGSLVDLFRASYFLFLFFTPLANSPNTLQVFTRLHTSVKGRRRCLHVGSEKKEDKTSDFKSDIISLLSFSNW